MKHQHAELMIAYANDTSLNFQWRRNDTGEWQDIEVPHFVPQSKYRIKPKEQKMLYIVGSDRVSRAYPEPVKEMLADGTEYYIPNINRTDIQCGSYCWCDDGFDRVMLQRGMVHLTEEAAIAHAKAMIGLD